MPTMGQGSSNAESALCIHIAHRSAPLALVNLKHVHRCICSTLSHQLHMPRVGAWPCNQTYHGLHGSSQNLRCICVNTGVCRTGYLSVSNWKRQRYELIYLCNLLWVSLCLIPSTPRNFQDRPRLTAFWENASLWHKNVFTLWFSKALFAHFDCRTNVQQRVLLVANKKNLCTLKTKERFQLWSNRGKKIWFMNFSVKNGL